MTDKEFEELKQKIEDFGEIGGEFVENDKKWLPQVNGKEVSPEERYEYITLVQKYQQELLKREKDNKRQK